MWRAPTYNSSGSAGQGAVKHKVFVGTDKAEVTAGDASVLAAEQAELTFSPADLAASTVYYWRVDEVDSTGKVTAGPVWSFSTIDPAGGAVAEYWNDINLSNDLSHVPAARSWSTPCPTSTSVGPAAASRARTRPMPPSTPTTSAAGLRPS